MFKSFFPLMISQNRELKNAQRAAVKAIFIY